MISITQCNYDQLGLLNKETLVSKALDILIKVANTFKHLSMKRYVAMCILIQPLAAFRVPRDEGVLRYI